MMNIQRHKSAFFIKLATLSLAISSAPISFNVAAQQTGISTRLEEVVVTARRVEETLQSVPVAVTAFSEQQLQRAGVEDIIDLGLQTPNLRYRGNNESGGVWVMMRGQNQVSGELNTDSPVGLYLDGVVMPRTRGLGQALFDTERVEILKGPQGTLYGRNSMAGAINLISRKPSHSDGVSGFVESKLGTYDYISVGGAVNVPVTDTLATRFAVQRLKRDGFSKQLSSVPPPDLSRDYESLDNKNQMFVRGSALWDPTENINVHFVMDWKELDEAPRSTHHPAIESDPLHRLYQRIATIEGIPGTPLERGLAAMEIRKSFMNGDIHSEYGTTQTGYLGNVMPLRGSYYKDYGGGLTASIAFDNFNLTSITGYRYQTITNVNDLDGTPYALSASSSSDEGDFWSQELRLDGTVFDRLDWQLGAYYSVEDAIHFGWTDTDPAVSTRQPSVRENHFLNSSWAGFGQFSYSLTDTLRLTVGTRFQEETKDLTAKSRDYTQATWPDLTVGRCRVPPGTQPVTDCAANFSDTFDKWSYLVSLDYSVTSDVMLYASTATGWRGGGQNSRGNITTLSFASFGPDTATNYEMGLKGDWFGNRVRTNIAAFYTKLDDLQRRRNIVAGALTAVVQTNAAEATILGFEFDMQMQPMNGVTLRANVGMTDASYDEFNDLANDGLTIIDRSNEPFEGISKWNVTLDGRYEWQMGPGIAGASANWAWESEQDHYLTLTSPTMPRDAAVIDAYGLVNARLDYSLEGSGLEFALWGRNIFDKKYLTRIQDSPGNGVYLAFPGTRALYGWRCASGFDICNELICCQSRQAGCLT